MPLKNNIYLFSNKIKNKDIFFQGYCFIGSDYIYGEEGALRYIEESGKAIPPGEDGCYVSIYNKDGVYSFVNDFHGYKKIFYYHREGVWVVSNSIVKIAEFLKDIGVQVSPNYAQLAAIGSSSASSMQQLNSYNTFVDGVKLLPSKSELKICERFFKIVKLPQYKFPEKYEEALSEFLETWVSRAETLLTHKKMQVTCNLTGGVDSRTCFAIFQAARKRMKVQNSKLVFTCGTVGGDKSDLEVASLVARKFGIKLNDTDIYKPSLINGENAYKSWRYLCLGAYHPIYIPGREINPYIVKIMGGGGGNHRSVYSKYLKTKSITKFSSFCSKKIKPIWLGHQIYNDIMGFFKEQELNELNSADPLIDHYAEFRNKFHAGRTPQNMVAFHPLGSKYSNITSLDNFAGNNDTAKINYDIIFSLEPELLNLPFDREYKAPSDEVKEQLVGVKLKEESASGKVYVGEVENDEVLSSTARKNKYLILSDEVKKMLSNRFIIDFWGEEKVDKAKVVLKELENKGKLFHAKDGQILSAILASSLFFNNN